MNEKIKKISVLEWGIAIAIVAIIIAVIHQNLTTQMNTSLNLLYAFMLPLITVIPFIIFEVLHYFILQKMLRQQRPFEHVQQVLPYLPVPTKNNLKYMPMRIYCMLIILTMPFSMLIGLLAKYNPYIKQLSIHWKAGGILIFAAVTTTVLLIFSQFYFAKPVKETWKAILLAGIIAGASSFALAYGLWKFVGPYLA